MVNPLGKTHNGQNVFRLIFVSLVIGLFVASFKGFAASSLESTKMKSRLANIEKQLTELEQSQNEIIAVQNEIIADIKNLKIWVNKRR